ncbi:helix-turn-helix domain-containing protein [Acrocarpospora catenulata]|uniref:helix-turn-helix domain-containing protein n=1 Tax=Acrocarpospora catenulata TaxID=2836182 RepID=UPI001BD9EB15|nr:helix-turn-helix transcriptional regulator [Acrocarpospora catenulata]
MADLHPVVAALAHRTKVLGLSNQQLALRIGVSKTCVKRWLSGDNIPCFGPAVRWAQVVGLRLAAVDGNEVWAEGMGILSSLAEFRRRRGIRQGQVARVRDIAQASISRLEHSHARGLDPFLVSVDDQLAALDLRLVVLAERGRNAA